jgi:uncharacterized HAD superfamily protein
MGRQLRIGVDIDGVTYDEMTPWIAEYNRIYSQRLRYEDMTDFDFRGVKLKCTPEAFFSIYKQADVQWAAQPIWKAMEVLTQLNADGHLICFISAGKRCTIPIKMAKLMQDLPDTPYEIHFTKEKWKVDVDVMIDDSPHFMRQWLTMMKMPPLIYYRQPWNFDVPPLEDTGNTVYSSAGWNDVYRVINQRILGEEFTW